MPRSPVGSRARRFAISAKVFVGNLSFDASRDEVRDLFAQAGEVVDVFVPTDRATGRPRGFAFVEFADSEAAQQAIARFNGYDLNGRNLRVNEAEDRPRRMPPGGGGGQRFSGAGGGGGGPRFSPPPPPDMSGPGPGAPFKTKGSRRNLRSRRRGFGPD